MMNLRMTRPAVCVAALLTSSAAFADVTAQEVWDGWKTNLGIYGSEGVTIGSETLSGGVLTVTDLGMNMTEDGDSVEANLASLVFTENGDGTVSVTMSEEYPIKVTSEGEAGPEVVSLALRHTGLEITVSGTAEEMTYDFSAARYAIVVDSVETADTTVINDMQMAMNNVAGNYVLATGAEIADISFEFGADSVDVILDVSDATDGVAVTLSGSIADFAAAGAVSGPLEPNDENDLEDISVDGGYSFGAVNYLFAVDDAGTQVNGTATAASGGTELSITEDAFSFDAGTQNIAVNITSGEIPFPVNFSLAEYGLGFEMPLSESDTPSDFSALVNISELTVNEEIWAMLDPGAILPRDPLTALIDIAGTATLLMDLTDQPMDGDMMMMDGPPALLNSLSLNSLNLAVGGAQVTGTGAFTFDNDDMTTVPGMPRPEGEANFEINGVNGLINKLVEMGLIPEDQAMMPRMMIGMFGLPVGDDMLTTKVAVDAAGAITINGAPMPF